MVMAYHYKNQGYGNKMLLAIMGTDAFSRVQESARLDRNEGFQQRRMVPESESVASSGLWAGFTYAGYYNYLDYTVYFKIDPTLDQRPYAPGPSAAPNVPGDSVGIYTSAVLLVDPGKKNEFNEDTATFTASSEFNIGFYANDMGTGVARPHWYNWQTGAIKQDGKWIINGEVRSFDPQSTVKHSYCGAITLENPAAAFWASPLG
jgi:hypothetical protein